MAAMPMANESHGQLIDVFGIGASDNNVLPSQPIADAARFPALPTKQRCPVPAREPDKIWKRHSPAAGSPP